MRSHPLVEDFLRDLTERERRILVDRLTARDPMTLDQLGQEFGVTRERVRQIETQVRKKLAAWPWDRVMSDVVPTSGSWLRAVDQILLTPHGSTWATPTDAGPTILELLLAADKIDLLDEDWVGSHMTGTEAQTSRMAI